MLKLTPAKPDRHRAGRATVRATRATGHLQILWRHEKTSTKTIFQERPQYVCFVEEMNPEIIKVAGVSQSLNALLTRSNSS